MYQEFFDLSGRPFQATPDAGRYYPAGTIESARGTLVRCIERAEGAAIVVGASGTGKSLLCQVLAEHFRGRFGTALVANGRLRTSRALLQAILYELNLPCRQTNEGELRLSLMDYLEPRGDGNDGLLLIVDEAHAIAPKLLEEVRLISNIVRGGQPRVRVVLAGSPALEDRLARPRLAAFSQRLAARCYLTALDFPETTAYIHSQLALVGAGADRIFEPDAIRSIYRDSEGVPRLVNQLCDHALVMACERGMRRLSSAMVEDAWADLQQLPTSWATSPASTPSEVVEFGSLDDACDEAPGAIPFPATNAQRLYVSGPEERLDAIQSHLSRLDIDVTSASEETARIDLTFPEFVDPFGERFAEEEVVLDRYRPDTRLFAHAPKVTHWESRQIVALLEPMVSSAGPARGGIVFEPSMPQKQAAQPRMSLPPLKSFAASPATAGAIDYQLPNFLFEPPAEEGVVAAAPPAPVSRDELSQVAASLNAETFASSDTPLIVVEEDPPRTATIRRKTKSEFRQLFSKLRRG